MRKIVALIIVSCLVFSIVHCGGTRSVNTDNPPVGESVEITLVDGTIVTGVILQREDQALRYVDVSSHRPERIEAGKILSIIRSNKTYDLEGNPITEAQISEQKGVLKTFAYGVGGMVLGAAVGFGVGVVMLANDIGTPLYPMVALGLGGAVFFGIRGAESDRQDAIDDIRVERYKVTQEKLKKELEQEQKKLDQQKKELEELKKKKSEG